MCVYIYIYTNAHKICSCVWRPQCLSKLFRFSTQQPVVGPVIKHFVICSAEALPQQLTHGAAGQDLILRQVPDRVYTWEFKEVVCQLLVNDALLLEDIGTLEDLKLYPPISRVYALGESSVHIMKRRINEA